MTQALLLVDLQEDFLRATGLEPCRGAIVERAAFLLDAWRRSGRPVVHVWTTVQSADDAMPHWRDAGRRLCVAGTDGHRCPPALAPLASETVVHKTFFSAFSAPALEETLRRSGVDAVVLAGVHLHGCVRATAIDAYQRGFRVVIAEDAVGSYDPVHADCTRQFLHERAMRFVPAAVAATALAPPAALVHQSPSRKDEVLFEVPRCDAAEVARVATGAAAAAPAWARTPATERAALLAAFAARCADRREELARMIALHVGKPIRDARGEIDFGIALVRATAAEAASPRPSPRGTDWRLTRRPLGVVAAITPFNNPFAVAIGKVAPALAHGNAVVWKPAPAGTEIARTILAELGALGLPTGVAALVTGDQDAARSLMNAPVVDGVVLTGSVAAGTTAALICTRRHIPLHAELGGNNGAVVWHDTDLEHAAREIALGAFASAGQRCTANRRVIVDRACLDAFMALLEQHTAELVVGPPLDEPTQVGPLVNADAYDRVTGTLERARAAGFDIRVPGANATRDDGLAAAGWYHPPTLVISDDPDAEVVQQETFGPVLVVQPARDFAHAMQLLNGVRQGLAAALFSPLVERREQFLAQARAGILKLDRSTAGAAADAPFGGWGSSGIGFPEHGVYDLEIYTRPQAVYDAR